MGRRRRGRNWIKKARARFSPTQGRPKIQREPVGKTKDYKHFLKSALWKHIRGWILKRDGGACQCCGEKATDVHHISYDQDVMDGCRLEKLISLCRACHTFIEYDGDVKIKDMYQKYCRLEKIMFANSGVHIRDWEQLQRRVTPTAEWFRERLRKYNAWMGIGEEVAPAPAPAPIPQVKKKRKKKGRKRAPLKGVLHDIQPLDQSNVTRELKQLREERKILIKELEHYNDLRNEVSLLRKMNASLEGKVKGLQRLAGMASAMSTPLAERVARMRSKTTDESWKDQF